MTPELKAKWLAALRSGKYQQGEGALNKDGKFCCLGVLCDVAGYEWFEDELPGYKTCSAGRAFIENATELEKLGLSSEIQIFCCSLNDGTFPSSDKIQPDNYPHSFKEIADWLEKNLN
jgi:hypothetical protein